MVSHFERELLDHRKDPPEKGARSRIIHEYCKKEMFLKYEVSMISSTVSSICCFKVHKSHDV